MSFSSFSTNSKTEKSNKLKTPNKLFKSTKDFENCDLCCEECCLLCNYCGIYDGDEINFYLTDTEIETNTTNDIQRDVKNKKKKKFKKNKRTKIFPSTTKTTPTKNILRDCDITKMYMQLPTITTPTNYDNFRSLQSTPLPPPPLPSFQSLPSPSPALLSDNSNFLDLYKSLENLCITSGIGPQQVSSRKSRISGIISTRQPLLNENLMKSYEKLPLHDKKILNLMLQKRLKLAAQNYNSFLVHKFHENEKLHNNLLKLQQQTDYKYELNKKFQLNNELRQLRLNLLKQENLNEMKNLRDLLEMKNLYHDNLLKKRQNEKQRQISQQKFNEKLKMDNVKFLLTEKCLNDELIKLQIASDLEKRLLNAKNLREKYLKLYQKQIQYENSIQKILHHENLLEKQKFDELYKNELKKHIKHKIWKTEKFQKEKQEIYNKLNEQAKLSASFRDLVRSVSPFKF